MRYDDDQMNITPEVAAFLGYAPAPSRQPARASVAETETPESAPDVTAILGRIIGSVIITIIGFLACSFVLMMIGFIGTVLSGPPAAATSVRPQINRQAPSSSRVQRRSTASQSASQTSLAYLPAAYDTGRVTTPLLLVHEMPRGGTVDPLAYYVPADTCLLYERANANGWRRVVSLDGLYLGYAQIYPTVAYEQQRMRPEYLTAVSLIRRIP
jgi:hypothetical protein